MDARLLSPNNPITEDTNPGTATFLFISGRGVQPPLHLAKNLLAFPRVLFENLKDMAAATETRTAFSAAGLKTIGSQLHVRTVRR
jgi:hypothetical protein